MVGWSVLLALSLSLALWTVLPASTAGEELGECFQIACCVKSNEITDAAIGYAWDYGRCLALSMHNKFRVSLHPSGAKSCLTFSSNVAEQYLVRGTFEVGSHDGISKVGSTFSFQVSSLEKLPQTFEASMEAWDENVSHCFIGMSNHVGIPSFSAIGFQPLQTIPGDEAKPSAKSSRKLMAVRNDEGSNSESGLTNSSTMAVMSINTSRREWTTILLVGCFAGGVVVIFLLIVAVTILCVYKRQTKVITIDPIEFWKEQEQQVPPKYVAKTFLEPEVLELKSMEIQQFSLLQLNEATNSFSNRIGEGGFGAVYHGTLLDGQAVAVKVRSANSIQGLREFTTELTLLSEIQHQNLVPLIGVCPEQQILVYPFMSNGSLQDRLYGEAARRKPLDWITRLNIALGAARGLHFLHSNAGARCIIHRDVKSSNILLDNSMVAKVADFGFSKYAPQEDDSMVSLEVRGTAGYLDPEYYSTQQLTIKSDVFSFGVVLLEILCGREPLNIHRPRPEWSLVEWAKSFIQDSNIQAIVDPAISSSYTPEAMWRVVEIALASVEPRGACRPTMEGIIRELEDALIIENNASQYMLSLESLASSRFSMSDTKLPPPMPLFYQFDPSPVFSEIMGSPDPR